MGKYRDPFFYYKNYLIYLNKYIYINIFIIFAKKHTIYII